MWASFYAFFDFPFNMRKRKVREFINLNFCPISLSLTASVQERKVLKPKAGILGFIFICFLLAHLVRAKTIFVRNADEIKAQSDGLQAGDTLIMKNGYWKDQQIVIKGTGNQQAPIVLKAETAGKVWLTGRSNLRIGGQYVVVTGLYFVNGYSPNGAVVEFRDDTKQVANHCRLTNSAIVDFNPPSKSTDYKWVSLYGQYNRVDHCYFAGKNHQGTTLVIWMSAIPDYHRIDHNHFGPRPELGSNGGETIRIGTSDYSLYDSYATVEWNYFDHCDGEIEIISNKSCHNTYRYNTFESCKGTLTLRHGRACEVYANFFFGNQTDHTGGVRIIGEDHRVYNNYFQDLQGTGYRAAISLVNGVPNSPLNRYFQVKRAQVLFNTIVNCYEPLVIGAGADEEKTLPPKDCIIANNAIYSPYFHPVITFDSQPINMKWEGNIFYGPDPGFENISGIRLQDPLLQLSADGLYRPEANSPLIGAAQDTFEFVNADMDGQRRTWPADVGADQISKDSVKIHPLKAGDTGPDWYPAQPPPVPVIRVREGADSLRLAVEKADDGDIIELVSDGGEYPLNSPLPIDKNITIRGKSDLSRAPKIMPASAIDTMNALFCWTKARQLNLRNLAIDGQHKVRYIFKNEIEHVVLRCDSLGIFDTGFDSTGAVFFAAAGSLIDTVRFENCSFFHGKGHGILAQAELKGSGAYDIANLKLENCTAWDYAQSFLDVYGGDEIPFTPCPKMVVNHCTFHACAFDNGPVINAEEVDFTRIENSIFSKCNPLQPVVKLYGQAAIVDYCDFFASGDIALFREARQGSHIYQLQPLFKNAEQGDFTLQVNSPLWAKADDGTALGDLRWTGQIMGIGNKPFAPVSKNWKVLGNDPNPFNGQTTIRFDSPFSGMLRWSIFDLRGRRVAFGEKMTQKGQLLHWRWNAGALASGIYYLTIECKAKRFVSKMILVR